MNLRCKIENLASHFIYFSNVGSGITCYTAYNIDYAFQRYCRFCASARHFFHPT